MTTANLICIAVLALAVFWAVGAYNRLIRLKSAIVNAFGQIDGPLKRRYDLIPNLVETTKKYLSHERETLEAVITAGAQAKSACDAARSRPANAQAVTKLAAAEQALHRCLGRLLAVAVACQELKADQTMRELSEELTSMENKVSFARHTFNAAVRDYNNAKNQFPTLLLAKLFSFEASAMLHTADSAEERMRTTMAT